MIPFSSDRKRMTTIYKLEDGSHRVVMKGAAEIVLKMCKKVINLFIFAILCVCVFSIYCKVN